MRQRAEADAGESLRAMEARLADAKSEREATVFWRFGWAARQMIGGYSGHAAALDRPLQFYTALLWKLAGLPGEVRLALRDGKRVRLPGYMSLYIYKEIFVDRCYDVDLPSSAHIMDIGANTGLFALRMKQLHPAASITCFEPYPPNFVELERTVADNHLYGVRAVPKAVGARAGKANLYVHRRNIGGHSLYPSVASSKNAIEVEIVPLGAVVYHHVDLLKLDCEGAEYDILMSMTPEQAALIDRIIIEPTPKLYDVKVLLRHMESCGYAVEWRRGLCLLTRRTESADA